MNLQRIEVALALACAVLSVIALALLWPHARDATSVLLAQDDPALLSDMRLNAALGRDSAQASLSIERHIEQALDDDDADLAMSFVELAQARDIAIAPLLVRRVSDAAARDKSAAALAGRFAAGFVTGDAEDAASLTGTLAGDLLVFGDIRDVVREGQRAITGVDADHLVLGLAGAGLAITAVTYASAGGAAPLRAGLTMVKDARKLGRLGAGLSAWTGRAARGVVDGPQLRQAVASASLARPGRTIDALKAAFKADKAGALMRLAKDAGRVGEKAGTKGALDVLRIADGPKDVARAARLAQAKGGQTRAIVKILGRGALVLASGAFHLAWWVFAALLALAGFVSSIKAGTERLTLAWIQRSKSRRARAALAPVQAAAA